MGLYYVPLELLLSKNAKVDAQGGRYDIALQASTRGHEEIIKLLLNNNEVNAQGRRYSTALHAAAARGHEQLVSPAETTTIVAHGQPFPIPRERRPVFLEWRIEKRGQAGGSSAATSLLAARSDCAEYSKT